MNVPEIFGSLVFSDKVMQERLPKDTYKVLRKTIKDGKRLDSSVTNVVASAMKDWAVENGATHYTHWFQPMTGFTAEKHDGFISPQDDGSVISEFTGKDLMKGEPDASSFPSGGLRATFEARGYTAWDPTSYAFIKDNTLCIPTAFWSYGGEALDMKTPLLRSMDVLSKQAVRILRLFGDTATTRVIATVGAEQEYFLIDKEAFNKRPDLIYCGRTLFGAKAPKDQQKDDHYFGLIKPRVKAFMKELDEELWKRGVFAKTEHNEAAPAQHELAPVFTTANIATDQNQLTMEYMRKVADKHGMACLLHEKPFAGINGSGKHNNWSLTTNNGENLLNPGDTPESNAQFLLFLTAVIKAVDEYQDLLRISIASAGNDHRLGAAEAPPAIISMFLGDDLTEILSAIANGTLYNRKDSEEMKVSAKVLPTFFRDTTDRNRTSPFAFTGNKFEFRMPGSSASIAEPNYILNTIVAEELGNFADALEESKNFKGDLFALIRDTLKAHERIIFNGNNYSDEWVAEAEERGLLNYKTAVDAFPHLSDDKNVALFTKHKIFREEEIHSRCEIMLENYAKTVCIEAQTMYRMVRKRVLPAIVAYTSELSESALKKRSVSASMHCNYEEDVIRKLSEIADLLYSYTNEYEKVKDNAENDAVYCKDVILPLMQKIRACADEAEFLTSKKHWPFPTYGDLLYSV
ncbi:MAG: glutamine synthetase III [Clostridia bacterium]|nr:glutamine synthetase III [Clostridia bacterium]